MAPPGAVALATLGFDHLDGSQAAEDSSLNGCPG